MSLASSNWLLGNGIFASSLGLSAFFIPRQFLNFWGTNTLDVAHATILSMTRQYGVALVGMGSALIYSALGDEEEQKHAHRTGFLTSLLFGIFWATEGVFGVPRWVQQFFIASSAVQALGFGYLARELTH
eukprot:TRINITY_DN10540_c0_g1_i1.p1 TRINITY_DN10540_c0_g1~~TRINITY_DN10540_c0_g1_i1.p1  ORF type:complete len:130 (+),score=24.65 TRINITY_DN10540_c0_g1_i1:109-498(+)